MTLKDIVRRYITVHKCGGCGEILEYKYSEGAFCPECRLEWNAALTVGCGKCFKPAVECTCMPKPLSKSGALCLRKLYFYESECASEAQMRIIFKLKRQKIRRMIDFVSGELYPFVNDELCTLGFEENKARFVISACPRGRASKNLYGFDQSELVAKSLCARLGVDYVPMFRQRIGGKEQKNLDRNQRMKNAKAHIQLRKGIDLKGKYLILYDDMVTTGASMSSCVRLAMKAGAIGVVCCSLACTKNL